MTVMEELPRASIPVKEVPHRAGEDDPGEDLAIASRNVRTARSWAGGIETMPARVL